MLYALSSGRKISASPNFNEAICPGCHQAVIPKCGEINIWHWAHKSGFDCDRWSEGETEWHLKWKSLFPANQVEVSITKDSDRHRADIVLASGVIVELQHSSINPAEMCERENFYGRMIWIFDVRDAANHGPSEYQMYPYGVIDENDNIVYGSFYRKPPRLNLRSTRKGYWTFRWKHAKKHIAYTHRPTFLDCGDQGFLYLKKMHPEAPVGGWGYKTTFDKIVSHFGKDILA